MNEIKYFPNSMRSEKARISALITKQILLILLIFAVILSISGWILIYFEFAFGWLLIGISIIPAMITEWYQGELRHLKINKDPKNIDDILTAEVLGRLSNNPNPKEVAEIIGQLAGGQFFSARFGIGNKFLTELSSQDNKDMQIVWDEAWKLRDQVKCENISSAILVVALIKSNPDCQKLLSHLQLDVDELIYGIKWYIHLRELIEEKRLPIRTGGLARDWSFGWTPSLKRFGHNVSLQVDSVSMLKLESHDEAVEQLIEIFNKGGRQNAMLVGQSGSGKTRIVHSFAARLMNGYSNIPKSLRYQQVFILDAAALIAAAPNRGGLEKLIPQVINEALSAKNIILCLDDAHLFFEDGMGSVNIGNILSPILSEGKLRIILAVDEQKFLQISKTNPDVVNTLNKIIVAPATRDETIAIMQDRSVLVEGQNHVTFMHQAMVESYRLGERYVYDLAMPGRALKIMEGAVNYSEDGLVTTKSIQLSVEKTLDIKVSLATDDEEREKLLHLEDLIHQRMINQKRAVTVVSDALRRARSGVRNQNRPIGTFLFLGPTGVGKTELAKALAEVYFGGENRIVRLDMNEYVGNDDVKRLIADAVDYTSSLTAMVMKQPFSVVLLDEIEKAHPNVLTTLLQMLDEGILRDIKNREVNFKDTIVIATSNAGADRIRELIERGLQIESFESQFIDELIKSNQFRPEFLNRFDEIVMFRPLTKLELLQVVDLMIAGVNKTMALQKIEVKVADDAKEYLVEKGYDPRLGARPMRRVVQKAVENTVAKQMLSGVVEAGSKIEISLDQVKEMLDSADIK